MRAVTCPNCGSELFVRFFHTLAGQNIKDLDDEQIKKLLREDKEQPFITLICSECQCPAIVAEEDNVRAITMYVEDKS